MDAGRLLIQLRDCFTAGYTMPQFCVDNKIRRPLFIAEKNFLTALWEIYVQFRYDKRLTAQFFISDAPAVEMVFSVYKILAPLKTKNFSELKPADFDIVICLTSEKNLGNKGIYLDALTEFFFRRTCKKCSTFCAAKLTCQRRLTNSVTAGANNSKLSARPTSAQIPTAQPK